MQKAAAILLVAAVLLVLRPATGVTDDAAAPAATGDAERGKTLFVSYHCYACHGSNGQTGLRRLLPIAWPQEAFIAFVKHSQIPAMPAYSAVPEEKLADVYAYLRSIPIDRPPMNELPILEDVQKRAAQK